MIAIFFNLLTNATFSLLAGLLVVSFFIWLFRVETGPWKTFLWSLPFLKIIYDVARGVPANSVLLSGVDPYTLPPKHQLFQVGTGFSNWGPIFDANFSVQDLSGHEYAASVGDYLVIWLTRQFGKEFPLIILSAVVGVSLTLITLRVIQAWRFEKRRKIDREHAKLLKTVIHSSREVDVYISEGFSGTPFTGGFLKPYICVPFDASNELNSQELNAVIAHEAAHIKNYDLPVTILIQLVGDLFWFVPGYRWLSRKIDRLREVVADQSAVSAGAEPLLLASALVKLKEIPEKSDRFVLYSAFFRERSLLKTRVEHLLGTRTDVPPRLGWNYKIIRIVFSYFIFMAVMTSTFGANHSAAKLQNPEWFQNLLKALGFF